jgi:hypothetical protein
LLLLILIYSLKREREKKREKFDLFSYLITLLIIFKNKVGLQAQLITIIIKKKEKNERLGINGLSFI